jgi:hypothetical protein
MAYNPQFQERLPIILVVLVVVIIVIKRQRYQEDWEVAGQVNRVVVLRGNKTVLRTQEAVAVVEGQGRQELVVRVSSSSHIYHHHK